MSVYQLAIGNGIFSPEDLTLLQSVFDEACARNELLDEDGRASVGRKIIIMFQGGTRDRELLLAALSMGARNRKTA
jgi:hypothetical protein